MDWSWPSFLIGLVAGVTFMEISVLLGIAMGKVFRNRE